MPTAAHLLDVVRGLVVCATSADLVEAFRLVCTHFEVLRVKNTFVEESVPCVLSFFFWMWLVCAGCVRWCVVSGLCP